MESQVFEDEVLAGAKRADNPPEEMPKRNHHGKNIIGTIRIQLCAKSFILQVYDVLARHNARGAGCSIGISEREQDYLDAQTWGAASPLHSRGLSVPIPDNRV